MLLARVMMVVDEGRGVECELTRSRATEKRLFFDRRCIDETGVETAQPIRVTALHSECERVRVVVSLGLFESRK